MRTLSTWAGRHTRLAILLLLLCELINGFNGLLLGATLLDGVPTVWLHASIIGLVFGIVYLHRVLSTLVTADSYWITRRWLFIAFLSNLLLFSLLGGVWSQQVQTGHPTASVLGSRRVAMDSDTLAPVRADSLRRTNRLATTSPPVAGNQAGKRVGYLLLGLLGFAVTYLASGIACNILCAGYGFLALLTFYAGLGGLAGTVYFFSRAFDKTLTRRRAMTLPERRRDIRRFWLAWLLFIGIFSLLLLVAAR